MILLKEEKILRSYIRNVLLINESKEESLADQIISYLKGDSSLNLDDDDKNFQEFISNAIEIVSFISVIGVICFGGVELISFKGILDLIELALNMSNFSKKDDGNYHWDPKVNNILADLTISDICPKFLTGMLKISSFEKMMIKLGKLLDEGDVIKAASNKIIHVIEVIYKFLQNILPKFNSETNENNLVDRTNAVTNKIQKVFARYASQHEELERLFQEINKVSNFVGSNPNISAEDFLTIYRVNSQMQNVPLFNSIKYKFKNVSSSVGSEKMQRNSDNSKEVEVEVIDKDDEEGFLSKAGRFIKDTGKAVYKGVTTPYGQKNLRGNRSKGYRG